MCQYTLMRVDGQLFEGVSPFFIFHGNLKNGDGGTLNFIIYFEEGCSLYLGRSIFEMTKALKLWGSSCLLRWDGWIERWTIKKQAREIALNTFLLWLRIICI